MATAPPVAMGVPALLERLHAFVAATRLGARPTDPPDVVSLCDTRRPIGRSDDLVKDAALVEVALERVLGAE